MDESGPVAPKPWRRRKAEDKKILSILFNQENPGSKNDNPMKAEDYILY